MKLPIWATILTVVGLSVLCSLGAWQLKRLTWKQGVLDAIEAEYQVDAMEYNLRPVLNDVGGSDFKRGYVQGVYAHDKSVLIQSRTYESVPGYHLITPLALNDGGYVFINRGWLPIESERSEDFKVDQSGGKITVLGLLRPPPETNGFVPENQIADNMWYRIDLEQMAHIKGVDTFFNNLIYAEREVDRVNSEVYPISAATKISPNNNHAQYAFFWFSMALVMLVVYAFRFIVPQLKAKR